LIVDAHLIFCSYEALGLLASVPLVRKGDKGKGAAGDEDDLPESLVSGYGQIVRDADGNVIDIILPEEPEEEEEDSDREVPKVEAKTDIAKSE
jgi:nucleolar protein 16